MTIKRWWRNGQSQREGSRCSRRPVGRRRSLKGKISSRDSIEWCGEIRMKLFRCDFHRLRSYGILKNVSFPSFPPSRGEILKRDSTRLDHDSMSNFFFFHSTSWKKLIEKSGCQKGEPNYITDRRIIFAKSLVSCQNKDSIFVGMRIKVRNFSFFLLYFQNSCQNIMIYFYFIIKIPVQLVPVGRNSIERYYWNKKSIKFQYYENNVKAIKAT